MNSFSTFQPFSSLTREERVEEVKVERVERVEERSVQVEKDCEIIGTSKKRVSLKKKIASKKRDAQVEVKIEKRKILTLNKLSLCFLINFNHLSLLYSSF